MYLFAMALTIVANTLYHVTQKLTPGTVHPLLSLVVTYVAAAAVCLALLPLFPLQTNLGTALRQVNWASIALGVTIVGLELGFLLAYRAGWNVSLGAIVSNVAVTLLLVPVGLVLFKEKLSTTNLIGIAICLIGLVLINRR